MTNPYAMFVGIDLGSQAHQVCVIDREGKIVGQRCVEHGGAALMQMLTWLKELTGVDPQTVAVALEAPRGAVVDALLERGHPAYSINPKQLDRFRDRHSVAGAKDDSRDSFVLADSLRTDRPLFRALCPDHPKVVRLRELSRAADSVQEDIRRCANQLWSYLQRYFAALLTLCPSADELWLLDLLELTQALPERAAAVSTRRLETLLRRRHIRRFSAQQLQQQLQHPLPLADGVAAAVAEQVRLLLPRLRLLHQQHTDLRRRTEQLLDEMAEDETFAGHRSVTILRSIPGIGLVFTSTLLSEAASSVIERDYEALRILAGAAPVTKKSGKTLHLISMRRACNPRLSDALFHASHVHMQKDPKARQIYVRLRAKSKSHARGLRGVGDRLLDLICVLLHSDQLYDPKRRLLAQGVAVA